MPNKDEPAFFHKMITIVDSFQDFDMVILGGDFNLVMDPQIDRYQSDTNNHKSLEALKTYLDKANLIDIWRLRCVTLRSTTTPGVGTVITRIKFQPQE